MLNRRNLLNSFGTGLSGIALTSLLQSDGLLADDAPIRPKIDPGQPFAARDAHFEARAKNGVLEIEMGRPDAERPRKIKVKAS